MRSQTDFENSRFRRLLSSLLVSLVTSNLPSIIFFLDSPFSPLRTCQLGSGRPVAFAAFRTRSCFFFCFLVSPLTGALFGSSATGLLGFTGGDPGKQFSLPGTAGLWVLSVFSFEPLFPPAAHVSDGPASRQKLFSHLS